MSEVSEVSEMTAIEIEIGKVSTAVVKHILNKFFLSGEFSATKLREMLENIRRENSEISHEEMQRYTHYMVQWLADKQLSQPHSGEM
ncbi:MAG TPA: hypothetical protein ENI56_02830 [Candidatus Kaiserbacteria bacterium]|nr:hypothetical protein [Candidatus Kaiserbacteria bacterium]